VVPTRRQSCARKADNYVFVACAEPAYDGVNFRASTEGNLSSLHVRPVISLAVHQMDMVCSKPCGCCECSVTSTRIFLVPCCTDCWHVLRRRSPCRRRTRFCRRSSQRSRKPSESKLNGTRLNIKPARLPRPS